MANHTIFFEPHTIVFAVVRIHLFAVIHTAMEMKCNCVIDKVQYQNMNRMKLVGLLYTADFHKCKLALSVWP